MSLTFKHPVTDMVVGPTFCGKTRFVFRLIDNVVSMLEPPPSKIMYCYGEYQQLFCRYPQVIFHEGLLDMDNFDGREPILLIVDDLVQETKETIANLFTKGSHHRNVSVLFLVQNLFKKKNKFARTISLNRPPSRVERGSETQSKHIPRQEALRIRSEMKRIRKMADTAKRAYVK